MFEVGDTIDVSKNFAIFHAAVVEEVYTAPSGSLWMRVRGIRDDGTPYKSLNKLPMDERGITLIRRGSSGLL